MYELLLIEGSDNIENSRGGIYNSSIFSYGDNYYIIGRCESIPESERSGFIFKEHSAILFKLDKQFNIISHKKLKFITDHPIYRIEDFRVFFFNEKIFVNHTFLKIIPDRKTTQYISELDIESGALTPIDFTMDIKVNDVEKNWLFFQHGDKLKMIYSLSPFILLSSDDGIDFKTEKTEIGLDAIEDYYISGSSNPTDLGNEYIFFAHFRDSEKVYHQIPILMDKDTLSIKRIEGIILSGGNARGVRKNVLYLMSHIKVDDSLIISFGEGDSVTTIKKLNINVWKK